MSTGIAFSESPYPMFLQGKIPCWLYLVSFWKGGWSHNTPQAFISTFLSQPKERPEGMDKIGNEYARLDELQKKKRDWGSKC